MSRLGYIALLMLGGLAGCSLDSTFTCASDESCAGAGLNGRCEAGWCTFEDPDCATGRRFSALAGDGLGGTCVEGVAGTDGSSSSTTTNTTTTTTTTTSATTTTTTSTTTGPDEDVPFGPWWDCLWQARVPLTVGNVGDLAGPFDDVVVLVALGPGRVDLSAIQTDGVDLRFVADDHQTELPYEIDVWNPSGASFLWVRLPTLEEGTRFFLYHDGPDTPTQLSANDTWPDVYRGVWHLATDGEDATSNGNVATGMVQHSVGRFGTGIVTYDFDPMAEYQVAPNPSINNIFAAGGTVSWWMRLSEHGGLGERRAVDKAMSDNGFGGWAFELQDEAVPIEFNRGFETGRRRFRGGPIDDQRWVHISVLYDDSGPEDSLVRVVADGVELIMEDTSLAPTGVASDDSDAPLRIGPQFRGTLDELRLRVGGTFDEAVVDYRAQSDQLLQFGPEDRSGCFVNPAG